MLLLTANHVVPTGRIIEYAWPGDPPDTAADLVTSTSARAMP